MPTYDYECDECGYRFQLRQKFDAEPETACSRCGGRARRRFHSVAVIYKGSGFYTTDYKNNSYSPPGGKEADRAKGESEEKPSTPATPPKKESD